MGALFEMRHVNIRGLVSLATRVRHEWAAASSANERQAVIHRLQQSLAHAQSVLRECGLQPGHLPAPSRRAYQFLSQVASSDPTAGAAVAERPTFRDGPGAPPGFPAPAALPDVGPRTALPESISFKGLRGFHQQMLDNLAMAISQDRLNGEAVHRLIASTCERLDRQIAHRSISAAQLKPASRDLVAWFRWFARPEEFEHYVQAVRRTQRILGEQAAGRLNMRSPLLVHFEPAAGLYSWRGFIDGTRISLATPWVAIDDAGIHALARCMMRDPSASKVVTGLTLSPAYHDLSTAIQATIGHVAHTRGMVRDLDTCFDRVNRVYFNGEMSRPKLAWTRRITGRVFGTYEHVTDRVSISSTLDRLDVPEFVLDHVMHHELLHKKHGIRWQGQRRHAHTPEFRAEECRFAQYAQAAACLNALAVSEGR